MSLDLGGLSAPVATVDDLVAYIKGAERPPDRSRGPLVSRMVSKMRAALALPQPLALLELCGL